MVKPNDTIWIDQDVTALLCGIRDRSTGEGAPQRLLDVSEQCSGSHEVIPLCPLQPVRSIQLPLLVYQNRPGHIGIRHVFCRIRLVLERDDQHVDPKNAQRGV